MSTCKTCKREMLSAKGCVANPFKGKKGIKLLPIRYGDETRYGADYKNTLPEDKRCHDCNCLKGQFHHANCDMEECPICHGQVLVCGGQH